MCELIFTGSTTHSFDREGVNVFDISAFSRVIQTKRECEAHYDQIIKAKRDSATEKTTVANKDKNWVAKEEKNRESNELKIKI